MDGFEILQPMHLAWLAVLPLLYLLSRPPRPKRDQTTAYLDLWLRARETLRRRPIRFRWLRFVLLVLAFTALVLAYAEPRLAGRPGVTDLVVLLDTSASMGAGTRPNRPLDEALAQIDAALRELPAYLELRVGLCGSQVEVLRGDRARLRQRLAEAEPGGGGAVDLRRLAAQLSNDTTAVWTLTDGFGATACPTVGRLTRVGSPRANLGITRCVVEDDWPLPSLRLRLDLHNYGPATLARLQVTGGVAALPVQDLELAAGQARSVTLELQRSSGGRVDIRLVDPADGLALDDAVAVLLPEPPSPTIAVRAEADSSPAVWAVARALAGEFGGQVVAADDTRAAFLISDGGELQQAPGAIRMLSFGTALKPYTARSVAPRLLEWSRVEPITAGLDLSELRLEGALSWRDPEALPAAAVPLMRGDAGVLAVAVDGPTTSSVHLAFRLGESNFFKLAAFPQFVRRAFARCYGELTAPKLIEGALLDPAESNLAPAGAAEGTGPAAAGRSALPELARPPLLLALPILLLALLLLVIRTYV